MGMLSCSAHRHYWESRLPFVSPSWPPPPSPPPRPKLMPTLSSSLDTGSPMPITSLPQLSPSASSSLRPSPSDRDATPSPTAPPRPLLSAGNAAMTYMNVQSLGAKGLVKKTAKNTGKNIAKNIVGMGSEEKK